MCEARLGNQPLCINHLITPRLFNFQRPESGTPVKRLERFEDEMLIFIKLQERSFPPRRNCSNSIRKCMAPIPPHPGREIIMSFAPLNVWISALLSHLGSTATIQGQKTPYQ